MSKKAKSQKKKQEEINEDDNRKAVLIGETFTSLLDPLTLDTPPLLLPICGIPIIELMLNSLNSMKEIIIRIKHHQDKLKKYIKKYHDNLNIKIIQSDDFNNEINCLDKIKQENLFSGDFILIKGLVILNADLDELYLTHKENKKKEQCLITSVMKKYKTINEIETLYDDNILIYNEIDKKIYQYEPTYNKKKIELFKNINSKENKDNNYIVRSDLLETGVYVINQEFIDEMLNKENNLQSMRDAIGQIASEGLYSSFLKELDKDKYCGFIRNIESYLKVNFEILNRWAYPIVIDNIAMSEKLKIYLKQIRFSLYSDKDTNSENFHKADLFSEVVILNKENIVGKESKLQKVILCKNVKIGEKCELYNCIIFNGAIIEDNAVIKNSIIGTNCVIKQGIKIISSILGTGITGDKDLIQKRIFYNTESNENDGLVELNQDEYMNTLKEKEKFLLVKDSIYGFNNNNINNIQKDTSFDSKEFYSDEESEESKEETFEEGVEYIINNGRERNKEIKELVKEIWNLRNDKIISNPTCEETLKITLSVLLKKFLNGKKFTKNKVGELSNLLKDWKQLFDKFVLDKTIELNLMSVLEQLCIEIPEINSAFHILVQILNGEDCNVIENQTIFNWNDNDESYFETSEGKVEIPKNINKSNKKKMEKYIDYLKKSENEDEEEEEEEDDDDNDKK